MLLLFICTVCKRNIKIFLRVSKKRDLSDQPDSGKQKKLREGSSEEGPEVDSVFTNGMYPPKCLQVLFNFLRNV